MSLKLDHDKWLSTHFKKPVYKLEFSVKDTLTGEQIFSALRKSLKGRTGFIYCKMPTSEICCINALEDAKFRLIDTTLILEKKVSSRSIEFPFIRFARHSDEKAIARVAKNNFSYSRFHLDPKISLILANVIKKEWATNFFYGKRGNSMIVAEEQGEVAGFLQLLYNGDTLVIDLIAVDKKFRKQGIASGMIFFAESGLNNFKRIRVGTQAANIVSMRFYEGLGFRIVSNQYVLHYHG